MLLPKFGSKSTETSDKNVVEDPLFSYESGSTPGLSSRRTSTHDLFLRNVPCDFYNLFHRLSMDLVGRFLLLK